MFTEQQKQDLEALINCIIPADDYPNGWDAGVGEYLLRQFEGDLQDKIADYQAGLSSLYKEAQANYEQAFSSLAEDQQTALLTSIEKGQVKADWTVDPAAFFAMAVVHCTEGYYSNPENGGNQEYVAWDMIGFEVRDERV